MTQVFNLSILGPPGAGKGTQASLLKKDFDLKHIETGDILRERVSKQDELGLKIKKIMLEGALISTDLLISLLEEKVRNLKPNQGTLFDGSPREVSQAQALERLLEKYDRQLDKFIFLNIDQTTSIERLSKRRVCQKCDHNFILGQDLKLNTEVCPLCGGKIFQRQDDNPISIKKRWQVFTMKTQPVVDYFKKNHKLILINGQQPIKKVYQDIIKQLKKIK